MFFGCCFVMAIGKCCARSLSLIRPLSWASCEFIEIDSHRRGERSSPGRLDGPTTDAGTGYHSQRWWLVALLAVVFAVGKATARDWQ